jgi:YD repeat-containing protein
MRPHLMALGLALLLQGGAEPRFAPADGLELSVRSVRVFELELVETELEVELDGESGGEQEPPGVRYTMVETETIAFLDRFHVTDGRLRALERSFLEIGTEYVERITDPTGEVFEQENPGRSELEGTRVRFEWDADGAPVGRRFLDEDEAADPELLSGLDPAAHLAGFLPGEAVEPGDEWSVELSAFVEMMNLSGSLAVIQEGEEESADDSEYGRLFDENLAGELEARLAEVRDEDGRRVAVIALAADLSTHIETTEEVEEGEASGVVEERHHFEFELEGELLWDLAGAHARSLVLEGDLVLRMESEANHRVPDHELRLVERQRLEGVLRFDVQVEAGP